MPRPGRVKLTIGPEPDPHLPDQACGVKGSSSGSSGGGVGPHLSGSSSRVPGPIAGAGQ